MNRYSFRFFNLLSVTQKYNKLAVVPRRNSHLNYVCPFAYACTRTAVFQTLQKLKAGAFIKLNNVLSQRSYSSDSDEDGKKNKSTALMKFDPVLKPEIILTIKNWIMTKLIIQPYLDKDFTQKGFTAGAKQALGIVSALLSQGDFQSLKGLVTDEAIQEIKGNFASLNIKERQDLIVKVTDILFAFPYQIGIVFDDANQKRFAEITVVYHCMNDLEELRTQGKVLTENIKDDIKICNYRFIREYTKGVESDWTINRIGHYKLQHFE